MKVLYIGCECRKSVGIPRFLFNLLMFLNLRLPYVRVFRIGRATLNPYSWTKLHDTVAGAALL